jgi:hypothetical protein
VFASMRRWIIDGGMALQETGHLFLVDTLESGPRRPGFYPSTYFRNGPGA